MSGAAYLLAQAARSLSGPLIVLFFIFSFISHVMLDDNSY